MIVISHPTAVANEINTIHSLFAEGLPLLHIRKPGYSETAIKAFITAVGPELSQRLVLHSHHHLANDFGINRLHYSKTHAETIKKDSDTILSGSTHSITEFNALKKEFDYAFLSPVFPSISKTGYTSHIDHLKIIYKRTNFPTKLIALGGISADNIQRTLAAGFDDVALLGTIWNSTNPLENFKQCMQVALLS